MSNQTLYVASSNAGKLRDFSIAAMHVEQRWVMAPLPGLASTAAPVEDGETFEANAVLKALYYAQHAPGLLVLADDSGLVVDALDGAPGVYSARYAERLGFPAPVDLAQSPFDSAERSAATRTDARNNACLLAQLARAGYREPLTARYQCVLAVARDRTILAVAYGTVEGELLLTPCGSSGFGYDPLFFLPAYQRTMAELDPATRLALSHRGQALRTLLPLLLATVTG